MASNTVTVGNTYIRYSADSSGSITITVADSSTGQTFASVFEPSGYNTGAALNEAQDQLNRKIRDAQRVINNPASTPEQIQSAQQTLAEATDASNYLSSNGNSDLQALIAQVQAQQPVAAPPPADTPLAPPPPTATGSVNDDSGIASPNPAGSPPNADPDLPPDVPTDTPALPNDDPLLPQEPYNDAENVTTVNSNGSDNTLPGKRLQNPLGQFSSYDYILSLYMMSPDAYTAFIKSGCKNVNALRDAVTPDDPNLADNQGAFLLAQSGGINNSSSQRAPYFGFDYIIDNLKIISSISPKGSGAAAQEHTITFEIIEPLGFSFGTNLRNAAKIIGKQAKQKSTNSKSGTAVPNNALRFLYVLGIKFIGYDANGQIMSSDSSFDGGILDPSQAASPSSDTFEYFIDMNINTMKFTLNGNPIKYEVTATPVAHDKALGSAEGTTLDTQSITANTVASAINQLMSNQTKAHKKQVKKGSRQIGNNYSIRWEPGTERIQNATIVSPADLDKSKWAGSGATSTKESNPKTESKAKANNKSRTIHISNGMSLVQGINNIIQQSSYLRDALKVIYDSDIEANPTKGELNQQPGGDNPQISWYSVTPQVTNPQWDTKTKTWAFDICYVIAKYDTPVTDSVYANQKTGTVYPGPYKRYKYLFTGKNTEVKEFTLSFDNDYYKTITDLPEQDNPSTPSNDGKTPQNPDDPTDVPRIPGKQTSESRTGGKGPAMESQNDYITSLSNKGAYTTKGTKLRILGDPDFLINPNAASPDAVYTKYYQSTHTVNPQGSQVMIEVDIVEAVDYDNNTGTMAINDSIYFFDIPKELAEATDIYGNPLVQGIPYNVYQITSTFSNGVFLQDLDLNMADLSTFIGVNKAKKKSDSGPAPKKKNSTTKSTGTRQDPPPATIPQESPNYGFGAGYAASL